MEVTFDPEPHPTTVHLQFVQRKRPQFALEADHDAEERPGLRIIFRCEPGPAPTRVEELDFGDGLFSLAVLRVERREFLGDGFWEELHGTFQVVLVLRGARNQARSKVVYSDMMFLSVAEFGLGFEVRGSTPEMGVGVGSDSHGVAVRVESHALALTLVGGVEGTQNRYHLEIRGEDTGRFRQGLFVDLHDADRGRGHLDDLVVVDVRLVVTPRADKHVALFGELRCGDEGIGGGHFGLSFLPL